MSDKLKNSVKYYDNPTEPVSNDSPWVTDGSLPPHGTVVIVEYQHKSPGRGSNRITDAYVWNSEWYGVPPDVIVTKWMYIPE